MKLKPIIVALLSFASIATSYAQQVVINSNPVNIEIANDSLRVFMKLELKIDGLDTRDAVVLTPYIKGDKGEVKPLGQIQVNGVRKQALHDRSMALKRNNSSSQSNKITISVRELGYGITFNSSLPTEAWMNNSTLYVRKEILKYDGDIASTGQDQIITKFNGGTSLADQPSTVTPTTHRGGQPTSTVAAAERGAPRVAEPKRPTEYRYKGSYISPESDETDKRNQEVLKFSLEEATIMAETSPYILSLRELYSVAGTYIDNRDKFYKIINASVELYPVHPTANLNAAAMAIEQGDTQAAGKYLQMASHDTLAYKNCRGVYELMIGNIYEGIRLLKAAKEAGSEEADYNLKIFFEKNKL